MRMGWIDKFCRVVQKKIKKKNACRRVHATWVLSERMRIKTTPKRGNDTIATTKDEAKHEVKDEPKNETKDETNDETKEQKGGNEESKPKPKSRKRSRGEAPAVPVACFRRLARAMANDCKSDLRWEASALQALQVATEAFAVEKFQKAGDTSRQFERKTLRALHA